MRATGLFLHFQKKHACLKPKFVHSAQVFIFLSLSMRAVGTLLPPVPNTAAASVSLQPGTLLRSTPPPHIFLDRAALPHRCNEPEKASAKPHPDLKNPVILPINNQ